MKEHPIIFKGEMVRAILDGRKTVTRRIVKNVMPDDPDADYEEYEWKFGEGHSGLGWYQGCAEYPEEGSIFFKSPYGVPGDRIWVRETWAIDQCGRRVSLKKEAWPDGWPVNRLRYISTNKAPAKDFKGNPYWWNSRPSIHMPRWASRITLEVVKVSVERLQDSGEEKLYREYLGDEAWENNLWVWRVEFKKLK